MKKKTHWMLCAENRELLIRMANEGYSLRKMSVACGAKDSCVKRFLEDNGFHRQWLKTPICEQNKAILLEMDGQLYSVKRMAETIGATRQMVRKFLKIHGRSRLHPMNHSGSDAHGWKGGRRKAAQGYVYIYAPNHPNRTSKDLVLEHRLVVEALLGRYLTSKEVVHHKNKNRSDNRPSNLVLFANNGDHLRHELKGHISKWTEDGLARLRKSGFRFSDRVLEQIRKMREPDVQK